MACTLTGSLGALAVSGTGDKGREASAGSTVPSASTRSEAIQAGIDPRLVDALGVLRRPGKPADAPPASFRRLAQDDRTAAGLRLNPAYTRKLDVDLAGETAYLIPGADGACVILVAELSLGGGCRTSAELIDGRFYVSEYEGERGVMVGLMPDGVEAVRVATEHESQSAQVRENAYRVNVEAGGNATVDFTGADGASHSFRIR